MFRYSIDWFEDGEVKTEIGVVNGKSFVEATTNLVNYYGTPNDPENDTIIEIKLYPLDSVMSDEHLKDTVERGYTAE